MSGCNLRLIRVLKGASLLLVLGLGYACVVRILGRGLGCPIHALTGLWCPGCGVSRMCMALLRGDLAAAWRANKLLLVSLPVLGGLTVIHVVRYIRKGSGTPKWEEAVWLGMAALFLVYGVLRNIPAFSFLVPATL